MNPTICIPFNNASLDYAEKHLARNGINTVPLPCADATHLLLPVPSFDDDGSIRGGGSIEGLLRQLPNTVSIIGGNLYHAALKGYETIDLLQDPYYVAQNAAITAHCALKYILNALPVSLVHQRILVIGWGRIGKCLAQLLQGLNAHVTILARKEADRAMAAALGYHAIGTEADLSPFRILINTAPAQVITEAQLSKCRSDCFKLDLASTQGIPGRDVIWARGLPGRDAPESSGVLIASSAMRLLYNKEGSS